MDDEGRGVLPREAPQKSTGKAYAILMVVHNTLPMVQVSTLRTLEHSAGENARLVVVDNASDDGAQEWLAMLARRGDIDLIRSEVNLGHGPALELARRSTRSPILVALDSDAFPLRDGWLGALRARLDGNARAAGIRHHRDYIHPSCLMVARETLDEWGLTFLDEKGTHTGFDVGERISQAIKERGFRIAGLERTGALRRGSQSEPVYLGSDYEGLVYHQWYTTRSAISNGRPVDDVPQEAMLRSLEETLTAERARPRQLTVVVGIRAGPAEVQRIRNARACLQALNLQTLARWRYRIVVVEQDVAPHLEAALAPLADCYLFAYNPGSYNRGWAFNIGAALPGAGEGLLFLTDADLLVPPDFLARALEDYHGGQRAILPYTEINYLDEPATRQAIQELGTAQPAGLPASIEKAAGYPGRIYSSSVGGCLLVDAALYRQLGGHDERFQGWGFEDNDFWQRLTQAIPVRRWPGRLVHLHHPRPVMDDSWAQSNQQLYVAKHPSGIGKHSTGGARRFAAGTAHLIDSDHSQSRPEGIGNLNKYTGAVPPTGQAETFPGLGEDRQGSAAAPKGATSGAAAEPPPPGRRPWEHWHRWSSGRIEGILHSEEQQDPASSVRQRLAAVLAGLCHPAGRLPAEHPAPTGRSEERASRESLLDVGCGPGAMWLHLAQHSSRLAWSGVDVTRAMLEAARQRFPGVPVQQADAGALPYASGGMDLVLLRHVLEHLPPDLMERVLGEALRVARRAVVVDFYLPPSAEGERQVARVGEGFLETRWLSREIQAPVERAGWWVEAGGRLSGQGLARGEEDEFWILTPRPLLITPEPGRPKISIIMATYHRPHTIFRTVQMIQAQTYRNWELIIVDNAGDGGYRFSDPRVRVYSHAAVRSASYARNQGLQYATGDLVCFFDDDDDMFPRYLERFATAFETHPAARMVRCGMLVSNEQVNFSYATPECCLRRPYATPTWISAGGPIQDQRYFWEIVQANRWTEANGTIVVVPEALCRANSSPQGGLRSGWY